MSRSRFERVNKSSPDAAALHVNVPIGVLDERERHIKRKLKPIDTKGSYPVRRK